MEDWSFPPKFDPEYLPEAKSRYWFPKRETMHPADREKAILERLKELTRYAYQSAPFYRKKWDEAGFHPDHLRSLEDFEDKVPVITKRDLRDAQALPAVQDGPRGLPDGSPVRARLRGRSLRLHQVVRRSLGRHL